VKSFNTFDMHLQSPSRYECISGLTSFVGLDASGSFGILAGHERMLTILSPGIMRLTCGQSATEYLGLSGGVLYFVRNQLFISTMKYLRGTDHSQLHNNLKEQIKIQECEVAQLAQAVRKMEESLLKRLANAERKQNL
jgi:F-type H+-transporting ATPase subunit epsilon